MNIKSNWAYRNGQREEREMNARLESRYAPKTGWVNGKYAERSKYDPTKLWTKGYANKTQANNKVEKLRQEGIECHVSATHPFNIIKD